MATLTVKNVGPIREAELEVKKHTIFIGPQGSGKSTLAKLIAIGTEPNYDSYMEDILQSYNIDSYISSETLVSYKDQRYTIKIHFDEMIVSLMNSQGQITSQKILLKNEEYKPSDWPTQNTESGSLIEQVQNASEFTEETKDFLIKLIKSPSIEIFYHLNDINWLKRVYIPAERMLISTLSRSIWKLIKSEIDLPKLITNFAAKYEESRGVIGQISISFIGVHYEYINKLDIITYNDKKTNLYETASGVQALVPLLLVVENERQTKANRFIIEEPELNLYPIAQKNLIYALVGGLQPEIYYQDAEWVITTHSPYVLSSYNTLLLAYKVAQKSEELREEVAKVIPERCWINPDDFAAYFVDNGTVRSIVNPKTGLIMDNELDQVSDILADEQDRLLELNRSVHS